MPAASCFGASVGAVRRSGRLRARSTAAAAAAGVCGAAGAAALTVAERSSGGYGVATWGPVALVLLALVAMLLLGGLRPDGLVAASAGLLLCTGLWAAASPWWGGVPDQAWTLLGRAAAGAAALVVGSAAAGLAPRRAVVPLAVLAAAVAQGAEILFRLSRDGGPHGWFEGRVLDGPVGYHNAQATVFLVALPIALWVADGERLAARAAGGAAAVLLLGPLLLTQSRSAVGALALALAVQVVWSGSATGLLTAAAVAGAGVALARPLQRVDTALLTGDASARTASFGSYSLRVALAAAVVGLVAAAGRRPRHVRRRVVAAVLAACVAVGAAGVVAAGVGPRPSALVSELASDKSPNGAPAGSTRLTSLTLNGRRDAWRVALSMSAAEPLTGEGQGTFARRWTVARRLYDLYILQPHSLVLELLAELGAVGLALMLGFAGLAFAAARRATGRGRQAAAGAVLVALLAQASLDWTWSFTAIVVAALLAVAALAGKPGRQTPLPARVAIGGAVCCGLLAASLLPPLLADRQLARATNLADRNPSAAWSRASAALAVDPWNADARSLEGRLDEARGRYRLAASEYAAAAALSQRPWLEEFRSARALAHVADGRAQALACRRAFAGNPAEPLLHRGPCAGALDLRARGPSLRAQPSTVGDS